MKNLILACSPRRGNTDALAAFAERKLSDAETVYLRDFDFRVCDGCGACDSLGRCKSDDAAVALYAKLLSAENIFFFAPVYFCGFDAHTKAFIDRGQYLWASRSAARDRNYYLVSCGGQRTNDNFEGMILTLKCHALLTGARYREALAFRGVDAVGDLSGAHYEELDVFLSRIEQK